MLIVKNGTKKVVKRTPLDYRFNDGGRKDAGFKGKARDCVTRAIAVAEGRDYNEVREELMAAKKHWMETSRSKAAKRAKSTSVRNGTPHDVYRPYLEARGWERKSLIKFGDPSRKELIKEEVPMGTVIVEIPKHIMAVIDHVVNDAWDSRETKVWVDGEPTEETKPRTMTSYWTKTERK
tara:strand:- start:737 stop:1273 length:537 start_codon:yes stop_codon:yes gene_type:complete